MVVWVGSGGPDAFFGTADRDVLVGRAGDDAIVADRGNDDVFGDAGPISVYDGGVFFRSPSASSLRFLDGLFGGNDWIDAGIGDDSVLGGRGNDTIYGGPGLDDLSGEGGEDELFGEDGSDTLSGGEGADTLNGGRGDDLLVGGPGRDVFQFGTTPMTDGVTTGIDLVSDFERLEDRIQVGSNIDIVSQFFFALDPDNIENDLALEPDTVLPSLIILHDVGPGSLMRVAQGGLLFYQDASFTL